MKLIFCTRSPPKPQWTVSTLQVGDSNDQNSFVLEQRHFHHGHCCAAGTNKKIRCL